MNTLRNIRGALVCLVFVLAMGCAARQRAIGLKTQLLDGPSAFDLSFQGNRSFPDGVLQKSIARDLEEYVERGFRPTAIDDAAYTLEVHYGQQGFPQTEVKYSITTGDDKKPAVRFTVHEGPRTIIREVTFAGAKRYDQQQLESHLAGPSTLAFGLGSLYYVESKAQAAASSIESLYYQEGYIDVRVSGPQVEFSPDYKEARLHYEIKEGAPHVIQSLTLAAPFDDPAYGLGKTLERFLGARYFPRITHQVRAACAARLANDGYADASCEAVETIQSQTGQVSIRLQPIPGARVVVGEIEISGNLATRTAFIRKQIAITPGEYYSRGNELESFRNLYATGIFSSVKINLKGQGNVRNVAVVVEEAQTLSTSIEVGYGSFERGRLLLGLKEANLFGTGRNLALQGKLAERARSIKLFFTDPYTIDREHVVGLATFIRQRRLVSFESQEYGTRVNLTHHITPSFRQIYGHEYRVSEAKDVQVIVPGLNPDFLANVNISALYMTSVLDTRDGFFLPKDGSWMRLSTEYASDVLGSELSFLRFRGRAAHYFPLTERSQFAVGARGGLVVPMQGTEAIPLQERFFNGGQNTVRSFREDELGPTDQNGKQVGGEAFSVFSMEYRRELFGNFSGALFADAGNVSLDHGDALQFKNMRYALGPGLRWLLPIGPLRLDWGLNPDRRMNERKWVLQFSLGVAF